MSMSKPALAGAIAAALLAACAVAEQRIGLALSVMLMMMVGTALAVTPQDRWSWSFAALAVGLALQPTVFDAGWVVAIDVVAALVAGAAAVVPSRRWIDVRRVALAPWRLVGGSVFVTRALVAGGRVTAWRGRAGVAARGAVLAAGLVAVFGALFATADSAFADVVDGVVDVNVQADTLIWRAVLGLSVLAGAGALALAGARDPAGGPIAAPRWRPARAELLIALTALVLVFAAFVTVQLQVLFGGEDYVKETTGLGYGEYARHGFVELLLVASLTLGVVGVVVTRSRDREVRTLLGTLCVLTLVVMASAAHRLDLVEDAYGATRVRYLGHAIVIGISLTFALVLAAGFSRTVARTLPHILTTVALAGVLVFSLSDPDRRIAQSAVDRHDAGQSIDTDYLSGLSADALPALEHLHDPRITSPIRTRLHRPDGLPGFNASRARARAR